VWVIKVNGGRAAGQGVEGRIHAAENAQTPKHRREEHNGDDNGDP